MSRDLIPARPDDNLPDATPAPQLSDNARRFARSSKSPNTIAAYRSYVAQWRAWCEAAGIPTDAAPHPVHVANWLTDKAAAGARPQTIRVALAAVAFAARQTAEGLNTKHPAIVTVLEGIEREEVRDSTQAAPLKADMLDAILRTDRPNIIATRDVALVSLLYLFGMRSAELSSTDWYSIDRGKCVLTDTGDELRLHRVRTKTIKRGRGLLSSVSATASPRAVAAVRDWIRAADLRPGEPICRRIEWRTGRITAQRLQPPQMTTIVRRLVAGALRDAGAWDAEHRAADYSSHSGRRGIITAGIEAGVPIDRLAQHVGHADIDTTREYGREAKAAASDPTKWKGVGV